MAQRVESRSFASWRFTLGGRLWAWVIADARPLGPVVHAGNRTLFEIAEEVVMNAAT